MLQSNKNKANQQKKRKEEEELKLGIRAQTPISPTAQAIQKSESWFIEDTMTYFAKSQTFEGRLNKRGKINKAWKERWFVLDEYEQKMEYYPSKEDAIDHKHLCGTIDISVVQRIEIISNLDQIKLKETELLKKNQTILSKFIVNNEKMKSNNPYSFQLVMSSRTYIFSASDPKSYICWLNELCRVIYGGIVHEGFLKKLGYRNKSWKQRYFTLNKYKQMKYYVDKTRKEFLGLIDLNLCILITNGKSYGVNLKYTIEIQTPNRTWIICPPDKQQKYEWEKMIKAVRWEKLNEQQTNNLIQQNLWNHHAEDIKSIQKNVPKANNSLLASPVINRSATSELYDLDENGNNKGAPLNQGNAMSLHGLGMNPNMMMGGNGNMNMDDQMYNLQKQMMMNNLMLANHLNAMNQTMQNTVQNGGMMGMPMGQPNMFANNSNQSLMNNNNNMGGRGSGGGVGGGHGGHGNNLGVNAFGGDMAHSAPSSYGKKGVNPLEMMNQNSMNDFNAFKQFNENNNNNNNQQQQQQQQGKEPMPDIGKMYEEQQNSVLIDEDDDQKVYNQNNWEGGNKQNGMNGNNNGMNGMNGSEYNGSEYNANGGDYGHGNGNGNGNNGGSMSNLKVMKVPDAWDASLIGQNNKVLMEGGNNKICRATNMNDTQWYNLFSTITTDNQVQYHWRIKINNYNKDWVLIIGIMDTCYIDEYVKYNDNGNVLNKNYFAKSKYGYGIDASGNLQNGGKNGGKYCNEFSNGDIVDVYFDMKQFVLWYGLNGKEYGVACKVHESFYKCCIAMFGPNHCVELLSCDTYFYPNK